MADALIPPYNADVIATQVLIHLGRGASYQDVWDLLLEYGLDPFEPSWETVLDMCVKRVAPHVHWR